jgi:hypothetical protein
MKPRTPFRVVPKRDFGSGPGFLINGDWVRHGFVVTDGMCNIMPGATWFQSIPEALDALAVYCGVHGNADLFWRSLR